MPNATEPLLLDTHVWVWLMAGDPTLAPDVRRRIGGAARKGELLIAAISAWEIAMLVRKGRLALTDPPLDWIERALAQPGISLVPLSPDISVEATELPGEFHGDPADRMIVASARKHGARLVTRDAAILRYGSRDHVRVLEA